MAWIETIDFDKASGNLRLIYNGIAGSRQRVDNVLSIHSLRPHTLKGHLALYKSVLHHTGNRLPVWFLEAIGVLVSDLNGCSYCVAHHSAGLAKVIENKTRVSEILLALESRNFDRVFTTVQAAALQYAIELTTSPASISSESVEKMRAVGLSDGEILEVNQVVSYFAYANRTVNGLGVTTEGDELGLSPPLSNDLAIFEHR